MSRLITTDLQILYIGVASRFSISIEQSQAKHSELVKTDKVKFKSPEHKFYSESFSSLLTSVKTLAR